MHPNPLFRSGDVALLDGLVEEIGFGMVFITTPDGPRVAHTPLLMSDGGCVRFHLSRRNALVPHLEGSRALVVVNGAEGYVSPRWYANRDTVPTWDYVTIEMEGTVRKLDEVELEDFLYRAIDRHEGRLGGDRWSAEETSADNWARQLRGITGFEMAIDIRRPTFKLSQKQPQEVREAIAAGQVAAGNAPIAQAMERFAP
ncbi:FMN-binding negative transcriptional regulator [Qipengyuania sp. RANM35]|uniref:FMN-binding negative transcriptional regulator n=1 Tax=Qipengyuania sp. RANM35 TaxID=3068635 RepID=UPI0034DB45F6